MNLFGTDGIRGIANADLSWRKAFKLGRIMGLELSSGNGLCVGKDTRASGDMLEASLIAGMTSAGRNVVRLGIVTTPGLSYLVREMGFGGGVMISASHNPAEYNGLKVFGPDGKKVPDELEERFSEFIEGPDDAGVFPTGKDIGRVLPAESAVGRYLQFLGRAPGRDLSGLKVVLDTANGSASIIAPTVWKGLAETVEVINDSPDGTNINDRCGSTHPQALIRRMKELAAAGTPFDVGFAYDGDGDRCIAVDEAGELRDGDHLMALLALDMAKKGQLSKGTVVGTVMSNYGLELGLRKHGLSLERTPVGDRYVLERMEEHGYKLGGEQSGHIIIRDRLWTGDGILTSLLVASVMAETGKRLSELASVVVRVPQRLVNVRAADPKRLIGRAPVEAAIRRAQADLGDTGRVVVRASGTEPLVRIMVECVDSGKMESCIEYLEEVIRRESETPHEG